MKTKRRLITIKITTERAITILDPEKQTCADCRWYEDFSGVCCCGASPFCADFTMPDQGCPAWKKREHREHFDVINEACRMGMEALKETRWRPIQEDPPTELEVVQITDGLLVCAAYLHIDGVWKLAGTDIPVTHLYPMKELTHWKPLSDPPELEP